MPDVEAAQRLSQEAQAALASDDFAQAKRLLKQAVAAAPQEPEFLEEYGALLAEVGPQEEVLLVLQDAVRLRPTAGHEKYMYLGQLLEDEQEAIAALRLGLGLLERDCQLAKDPGGAVPRELRQQLCAALCALGERLTAAHDDDEADEAAPPAPGCEAEVLLRRAHEADPTSPEPLQALAALQVEQGLPEEALASLRQSLALWWRAQPADAAAAAPDTPGRDHSAGAPAGTHSSDGGAEGTPAEAMEVEGEGGEDGSSGRGEGAEGDEEEEEEEKELPSLEFRLQTARLLLELDASTAAAAEILEDVLQEDDGVVEAWYLLALSRHAACQFDDALHALEEGRAKLEARQAGQGPEGISGTGASAEDFDELQEAVEASEKALEASEA